MIVKNEAAVIARCIQSVRSLITTWVIVDTGSVDGTQNVVRLAMTGIAGELHERRWRDFGYNRTEALELARGKADYVLVMDADDVLVVPDGFVWPELTEDAYKIRVEHSGTSYWRTQVFRSDLDFRYTGVLHEVLTSTQRRTEGRIEGLVYRCMSDGARSADGDKFRKDAAVLASALEKEPDDARYAFYLAQSWRDAGELSKALSAYAKRAQMGGWEEEVWYSLLEVAKLTARIGSGDDATIAAYLRAYERRPTRAESLCYLARHLRERGRRVAAYPFARAASEIAPTSDILFVDDAVYAWQSLDEYAVAAYWTGHYREAFAANERLLASDGLPKGERGRVEKNLAFCRSKLSAHDSSTRPDELAARK